MAFAPPAPPKPKPATDGRENWKHGKAVLDGELRYLSASALQLGDASTDNGCARRWFYAYARGMKDPPSKATERGSMLHAEVEKYLLTSSRAHLSSTVLSAMHMIPEPGKDLWIEHDLLIHPDDEMVARDADLLAQEYEQHDIAKATEYRNKAQLIRLNACLDRAPLRAAGIPIVGKIDCMHRRGVNKGAGDVTDTHDPPGTVEVLDWKFTGSMRYAKTASELPRTIQMALYAKFVHTVFPDNDLVRLSHGYVPTKGSPTKVTTRVSRDQIAETWNRVEALAGYLRDAAKTNDPDQIEANTKACNSFGRPCPASGVCRAAMTESLASVVGLTSAENLLKKIRDRKSGMTTKPPGFGTLGARLGKPATVAPAPGVRETITPEEVAREKARLAKAAVLAKHPGLDQLVTDILACGLGFPTMVGEAASAVGTIRGQAPLEYKGVLKLEGDGELSEYEFSSVETLAGNLGDIQAEAESRASAPAADPDGAGVLPPPSIVPPETPESTHTPQPQVAAQPAGPISAVSEIAAQAEGKPAKRGRPKKVKTEPVTQVSATAPQGGSTTVDPVALVTVAEPAPLDASEPVNVYVNCALIEGVGTTDLSPIIDVIVADLNALAAPEIDFRFVNEKHALAYGKWRGALTAIIREYGIEGGNWRYQTLMSDLGIAVVEALRDVCRTTGGRMILGQK